MKELNKLKESIDKLNRVTTFEKAGMIEPTLGELYRTLESFNSRLRLVESRLDAVQHGRGGHGS